MNVEKLKNYIVEEESVVTSGDMKHIQNYKQLISFFENAVSDAVKDGTDFRSLHASCIQCIRYLDSLIVSYENSLNTAKANNNLINEIIRNNTPLIKDENSKKSGEE